MQLKRYINDGCIDDLDLFDGWKFRFYHISPDSENLLSQFVEELQGQVIAENSGMVEPMTITIFDSEVSIGRFITKIVKNRRIGLQPFEMNTINWLLACTRLGKLPKRLSIDDESNKFQPFSGINFDTEIFTDTPETMKITIQELGGTFTDFGCRYVISNYIVSKNSLEKDVLPRTKRWVNYTKKYQHLLHPDLTKVDFFMVPVLAESDKLFEGVRMSCTGFDDEDREILKEIVDKLGGQLTFEFNSKITQFLVVADVNLVNQATVNNPKLVSAIREYFSKKIYITNFILIFFSKISYP